VCVYVSLNVRVCMCMHVKRVIERKGARMSVSTFYDTYIYFMSYVVAVCCSVLQCVAVSTFYDTYLYTSCHVLLQCAAVCCSVLQQVRSMTHIYIRHVTYLSESCDHMDKSCHT